MVMFEKFKIPPGAESKSHAEAACTKRRGRNGSERQPGRVLCGVYGAQEEQVAGMYPSNPGVKAPWSH